MKNEQLINRYLRYKHDAGRDVGRTTYTSDLIDDLVREVNRLEECVALSQPHFPLRCPKCNGHEDLHVTAMTELRIHQEENDDEFETSNIVADADYSGNSPTHCSNCRHRAPLQDFYTS